MDIVRDQAPLPQRVLEDRGKQRLQIAGARSVADLHEHAQRAFALRLRDRGRFVIRTDAGRYVGHQFSSAQPRSVSIHGRTAAPSREDLFQNPGLAGQYGREVHHLRQPPHALVLQQPVDRVQSQHGAGTFPRRRGDARRRHEENIQRQSPGSGQQHLNPPHAQHIADLVRISHDGGRPMGNHQPRQLARR